jgi:hypothetical protein
MTPATFSTRLPSRCTVIQAVAAGAGVLAIAPSGAFIAGLRKRGALPRHANRTRSGGNAVGRYQRGEPA